MAMVTLRCEPESYAMAFADGMHDLGLSRSMRLDDVVHRCEESPPAARTVRPRSSTPWSGKSPSMSS